MNHKDRTYCAVLGYFYRILQTSSTFLLTHDCGSNSREDLWHLHLLLSRSIHDKWIQRTFPVGRLYSRATYIQGIHLFSPENAHLSLYLWPLFKRHFFSGERETFLGHKRRLQPNLYAGSTCLGTKNVPTFQYNVTASHDYYNFFFRAASYPSSDAEPNSKRIFQDTAFL